jgi:hypothetical protein
MLEAVGGWGWGQYKQDTSGPNHSNFIGHLALGYFPTPKTTIGLRAGRSFHDSLWGNYYTDIGGSLVASHVFRWNMRLASGLGFYSRRYAGLPIPGVDTQDVAGYVNAPGYLRKDKLVSFSFQLEQAFGKYLVVGARYAVVADITDFEIQYANGFNQEGQFTRHLAMAFVAVRY